VFLIQNDSISCSESENCFNVTSYDRSFITYCFCLPSKIYSSKFDDTTTIIIDIIFKINFSDTVDQIIIEDIRKRYSKTNSLLQLKEISQNDLKKEVLLLFKQVRFSYKLNGVESKPMHNLSECIQMKLIFIPKEEP
jgi:hypothetical protein